VGYTLSVFAQVGPFGNDDDSTAQTAPPDGSFRALLGGDEGMPYAVHVPVLSADPPESRTIQATAVPPVDERVAVVEHLLAGRPLAPHAAAMVAAADQHHIDWRLLPVISILESQAGLTACGGNAWGFAKCQVRFASFEEGIPIVAATLASYGPHDSATLLCIWVSGRGCHTRHAISYSHRAAYLYRQIGASLPVRPLPAEVAAPPLPPVQPDPVSATAPEPASPTPTATPSSPEPPSAEPSPEPTPSATATP
jgi:hypothetical protein